MIDRDGVWVRITVSLFALLVASAAQADGESREFWVGHGTLYSPDDVTPIGRYQIELEAVNRGPLVISTFRILPDGGGNEETIVCMSLLVSKAKSIVRCGESAGEGVRIGSMLQNTLRRSDGTTTHTTTTIDDGGERSRTLRTRIAADGSVIDYSRDSLEKLE